MLRGCDSAPASVPLISRLPGREEAEAVSAGDTKMLEDTDRATLLGKEFPHLPPTEGLRRSLLEPLLSDKGGY